MHTILIYERSPGRLILSFVKSDYVRDNAEPVNDSFAAKPNKVS